MSVEAVLSALARQEPQSIARLVEWLRIPSVSTDPAYRDQVRRAAQWCADQLKASGLIVSLKETGKVTDGVGSGHPIVLAHCPASPHADYRGPHVLFYGHYDVQPPDPLELWESPPFEPVIRGGGKDGRERIVARGAVDDKGQVMMFLEALRAWKAVTGRVGGGVKFTVMIEGEEESSSVNLKRFIQDNKGTLGECGVCVISDTGMLSPTQPAITYGVRGLAYTEVTLHAANQDLHSGLWGGRAPNPINELAKVLAQLWDSHGLVTIPGFYDKVIPLTEVERAAWRALPFNPAEALAKIGLPPEADQWGGQEQGYSALEREWGRPTADINGIVGGYTGHGAKTIIASKAMAKVSFRLVADQQPQAVTDAFFDFCRQRTPPGCRWDFTDHGQGSPATVPIDSPYLEAASRAVERAAGVRPVLIKTGGSIPVAGLLKQILGLETIFMGFGLDDDRLHSPNEKFELACFRMGARSHAILIDEFGKLER